tara:strand:- start:234 stop:443 length:210 start_codon:yes stop_codon:yes gene_type:complete
MEREVNRNNIDNITFHKMILIYNALNDGWNIQKKNNKLIFTKNHEGNNIYYLDNYLSTFMKEYLNTLPN